MGDVIYEDLDQSTSSSVEPFESQTIEFHKMEEGGTLSSLRPWFTDSLTFLSPFKSSQD